jgi:hypothetical protein
MKCAYNEGGAQCVRQPHKQGLFCKAHRPSGKLRRSSRACTNCENGVHYVRSIFGDLIGEICRFCGGDGTALVITERRKLK